MGFLETLVPIRNYQRMQQKYLISGRTVGIRQKVRRLSPLAVDLYIGDAVKVVALGWARY